jgi:hypothetical protein
MSGVPQNIPNPAFGDETSTSCLEIRLNSPNRLD